MKDAFGYERHARVNVCTMLCLGLATTVCVVTAKLYCRCNERITSVLNDSEPHGEAKLVERLRSGCDRATAQFVREHGGWMLSVARRYVKDGALAEDCVQDAFLNAFRKIGEFEGRSTLKSWLHRIVVNSALMKLRSRRHEDGRSIDDLLPEFDTNDCRVEMQWQRLATPAEIVEREDIRSIVMSKINELPDKYRIILLLRDIEELSTLEVAELLEISESNVKVRLHRGRAALKKLLEPVLRGEV